MDGLEPQPVPKLIVVDLDGTVWWPEMYMLWGSGGPPFSKLPNGDVKAKDGTKVYLLEDTRAIMAAQLHDPAFAKSKLAISSATDEPEWAQQCLQLIEVEPGVSVKSLFSHECISKGSKRTHFVQLQAMTGIAYNDMIFFDNEPRRVKEVAPLGVTAVHCPDGLTWKVWNKGMESWRKCNGV
ncbi:magnesium-dependent phosphatase-1 [Chytriomyces sp. MP71]|nr:magnesium-dependent phosphatase-1 [Chytriomyces sp. MP71]